MRLGRTLDSADLCLEQMFNFMQFRMFVSSSSWQHAILVVFENLFDHWFFHPDLNPYMYPSAPSNLIPHLHNLSPPPHVPLLNLLRMLHLHFVVTLTL